mmetsp:Transcript_22386/g.3708  ORF Transcript_22386/g.3708 Transcript_22386/m.3708 type:complete len:108 (+) Transcript_22386:619-942(+)
MTWLIELTREMWQFAYDGQLFYEKAINFLNNGFERMITLNMTHEIKVIIFGRVYYDTKIEGFIVDSNGNCYCDVYKDLCTVVNSKRGFRSYLRLIRKEILHFPAYIN